MSDGTAQPSDGFKAIIQRLKAENVRLSVQAPPWTEYWWSDGLCGTIEGSELHDPRTSLQEDLDRPEEAIFLPLGGESAATQTTDKERSGGNHE